MKKGILIVLFACLAFTSSMAAGPRGDMFKGKLFPPNVILENQAELNLTKEQFTAIRAAVVEVQAAVAELEWDMREAQQNVMAELDKSPVNEKRVLEHVSAVLAAENRVKKQQMTMLIRVRNLLTPDQLAYLESVAGQSRD